MSYGYTYTFPALRGLQAGREYYVAMCPLKLLPKIFLFDEASLPPELRAQRTINIARVPEIARYVVENRYDYAFSAITASIDGDVRFEPADLGDGTSDIGRLILPMSARFVINDGQHRRAAIELALEEHPDLGDETIAVVLYMDVDLQRTQQLFADLNKHAVRPSQSLGILYDSRDPLATFARELATQLPCFKGLTEMEMTSISNRSVKLFTLNGIYQATAGLLGKHKGDVVTEEERRLVQEFWTVLGRAIPEWELAAQRKVSPAELRRDYVHAHTVVLHALGLAGRALVNQHPHDWTHRLETLRGVNWLRTNTAMWEGRAMTDGQMSKARQNLQRTTDFLREILRLHLDPENAVSVEGSHHSSAKAEAQPARRNVARRRK